MGNADAPGPRTTIRKFRCTNRRITMCIALRRTAPPVEQDFTEACTAVYRANQRLVQQSIVQIKMLPACMLHVLESFSLGAMKFLLAAPFCEPWYHDGL